MKKTTLSKSELMTLIALGLALFVVVLDGTIMNVSMKAIMKDLGINPTDMQFLITAYSLVLAAFTLIGSRLGDIFGRKKMFLSGAFLFGIGAVLAATAKNSIMLFVGWSIIEGLGAALMMPATMSLLTDNFTGAKRALGFGIWGAIASVGASLGPLIGGYVTTHFNWRIAFWIEFFPIILVFVLAKFIYDKRDYLKSFDSFDIKGAFFSALGLSTFVYGTLKAQSYGWIWPKSTEFALFGFSKSFIYILIGAILIIIFAIIESKCSKQKKCTPLIEPTLFKSRQFVVGLLITLFQSIAQSGFIFILPLYFLLVKNYTAVQTGIALLPITISVMFASIIGTKIKKREKLVIFIGFVLASLSAYLLSVHLTTSADNSWLNISFVLFGTGLGLVASQLTNITISAHPNEKAGEASGVNSTFRRVGATLGTSIMGSILFSNFSTQLLNVFSKLGGQGRVNLSHISVDSSSLTSLVNNPQVPDFIVQAVLNAFVDSARTTLLISAVSLIVVSLLVFALPKKIKFSK